MNINPRRLLRKLKHGYERAVGIRNSYFDDKLKSCSGLLHVGANIAQEGAQYEQMGLAVVWVEGLPDLAEKSRQATANYPNQFVVEAVVSDKVGVPLSINRANNNGASSSILGYVDEANLWPEIEYVEAINAKSNTIDNIMDTNKNAFAKIDACLLDIQGAELLALKGATRFLKQVKIISVETSEMELYEGGPKPDALANFLTNAGFTETKRNIIAGSKSTGFVYDGIWERA